MTEPQHTDQLQHLLDQHQAGDASACEALLQHSLERFHKLACRMLHRQMDLRRIDQTDDVLQKALIRLHGALQSVKPPDVRAFYGLAARQIGWVLRDLARDKATDVVSYSGFVPEVEDPDDGPHNLLEWSEMHEAIAALPEHEREMFDLLFYEGLSQEEAAAVLETSVRTVRRRWQRARLLLDQLLHAPLARHR